MEKKESFFNTSMIRFIIVGLINTGISTAIMFVLHRWLSYWPSTFIAFSIASVGSFFMNKKFTFKSEKSGADIIVRFIISLALCYFIVYFLAYKIAFLVLSNISAFNLDNLEIEKIAMILAQIIFPGFNYLGQRFFVFK